MVECCKCSNTICCIGYDSNPCCRHHIGCDAICIEYGRDKPTIYLVEVKKGKFKLDDAKESHRQLEYCMEHIEATKNYAIKLIVISNNYTHDAIRRLFKYGIMYMKFSDKNNQLPSIVNHIVV